MCSRRLMFGSGLFSNLNRLSLNKIWSVFNYWWALPPWQSSFLALYFLELMLFLNRLSLYIILSVFKYWRALPLWRSTCSALYFFMRLFFPKIYMLLLLSWAVCTNSLALQYYLNIWVIFHCIYYLHLHPVILKANMASLGIISFLT